MIAEYYGPCDVRSEHGVMRLHCYVRPSEKLSAYVDDRYQERLHMIASLPVTLCLPGGVNLSAEAGDQCARVDEPIGWELYAPEDEVADWRRCDWDSPINLRSVRD